VEQQREQPLEGFLVSEIGEVTEATVDEAVTAPVDAPVDGQAEGGIENQEEDIFDVAEFADKHVVVKVDGEEVRVPLSEALAGYQRQADYTRKTQKLSQASALQSALDANPQATLQLLQQTYGVQLGNQMAAAVAPEAMDEVDDGWDMDDPVARELLSLRSEFAELQRERMERQISDTLTGLKEKYGDLFDEQEVIQAAWQRQIDSPAQLEEVFRITAFDKFLARAQAGEQYASQQAAENAAREQAKAELGKVVSSGNGVPQSHAAPPVEQINSFEDAFNAAKRALGGVS
jgi:flagellar motility protein MotE (MotC chaperone)